MLTAEELKLSQKQHQALVNTLQVFEAGKIPADKFNMRSWCGTAFCIGGWAEVIGNDEDLFHNALPIALANLFFPLYAPAYRANTHQAAWALRNYLTTGKANWREAMLMA